MGKDDRDVVARRELTHALEALGDGIGHDTWGPGPVIERLSKRELKEPAARMATEALEAATMASHDLLHRVKRDDALTGIRRLAPVFLELIIEKDEGPKPVSPWRRAGHLYPVQRAALSGSIAGNAMATLAKMANHPLSAGGLTNPVCFECGVGKLHERSVQPSSDGYHRCTKCHEQWLAASGVSY